MEVCHSPWANTVLGKTHWNEWDIRTQVVIVSYGFPWTYGNQPPYRFIWPSRSRELLAEKLWEPQRITSFRFTHYSRPSVSTGGWFLGKPMDKENSGYSNWCFPASYKPNRVELWLDMEAFWSPQRPHSSTCDLCGLHNETWSWIRQLQIGRSRWISEAVEHQQLLFSCLLRAG